MKQPLWERIIMVVFCLCLFWLPSFSFSADSFTETPKTVRVGWYPATGLEDILPDQTPAGYNYEYLMKIRQYTNWQYEFVFCTWPEAEAALIKGDVDIVGDVAKTDERMQLYNYCEYPNGSSHMLMVSRMDDDRFGYNEYTAFNGKTVATIPSSFRKRLIEREGKLHGFSVHYKEYPTEKAMFEGLDNGEADLAIFSNVTNFQGYKIVSEWEANPFYFVIAKNRPDLLEDMNAAMKKIEVTDPFIQERLFRKYFENSASGTMTAFTREEMDYIKDHPRIKVLMVKDNSPVAYLKDGEAAGIAVDYVREVAAKCGLEVEFIFCGSDDEMYHHLRDGEGDVCAHFRDDVIMAQLFGAWLTKPYLTLEYGVATKVTGKSELHKVSVVHGRTKLIEMLRKSGLDVTEFPNAKACLDAVVDGKVDGAAVNGLEYEQLGYHADYVKLFFHTLTNLNTGISLGVSDKRDRTLYSILSKGTHAISDAKITEIINQNSLNQYNYTINDYLQYGMIYLLPILILLLVIGFLFSWNQRQKKFGRKLQAEKIRADQANRAKSIFFATISHDMRTPLNGVIGYTGLAIEANEPSKIKDYLRKIHISGELLLALINDVLDFGKYVSHKINLQPEPVKISRIMEDIETVIRPLADNKHLTLRMECTATSDGFIEADSLRLQQLFVNLLSNSVKFTRPGGVIENIVTEIDQGDHIDCTIIIRDNGIGMSKEFLPRIFEPYSQEERRSASKSIGTGLGMAIVKQIVDLMGGSISVDSEIDAGTTFTVNLSLKKYAGTAPLDQINPAGPSLDILQGRRVLLCEDNDLNAEIAQLILEKWGMQVTWTDNGQKAVTAVKTTNLPYDIILMDKRMPVMDGIKATQEIRRYEADTQGHIPIVAMTGDADEASIQSCLAAGMDAHVEKPINRDELARTLVEMLRK